MLLILLPSPMLSYMYVCMHIQICVSLVLCFLKIEQTSPLSGPRLCNKIIKLASIFLCLSSIRLTTRSYLPPIPRSLHICLDVCWWASTVKAAFIEHSRLNLKILLLLLANSRDSIFSIIRTVIKDVDDFIKKMSTFLFHDDKTPAQVQYLFKLSLVSYM